jgi:hemolysin activation/secretion protein
MKSIFKHLAVGIITVGLTAMATTGQTQEEQTQQQQQTQQDQNQQNQEQQQQQQTQQDQSQQQQQQEQQRDCNVASAAYLEIFVPDCSARVYLQGQLMAHQRGSQQSFVVPVTNSCKEYDYSVIVTYQNRAQDFHLKVKADQIHSIGIR